MKQYCSVLLLYLIQFTLRAEINTTGIPEGAIGFVYFNQETYSQTLLGKLTISTLNKKLEESAGNKEILMSLKNIKEISLGIYTHLNTAENPENPQFVSIFRGHFSKSKIDKFFSDNQVACQKIQDYSTWDVSKVETIPKNDSSSPKSKNQVHLIAYSDDLLIICSPELANSAIDAVNQKKNSYKLPTQFTEMLKYSPQNWLAFYGDSTMDPTRNKESGLQYVHAYLGENNDLTQLRCFNQFTDENKTKSATLQLKTTLTFLSMALSSTPPSAKMSKESLQAVIDLLNSVKISSNQSLQTISADYPSKRAADAFEVALKQTTPTEKLANEKN